MTKTRYGTMPDGRAVEAYTLENGQIKAQVLTYGATLEELWVPDSAGRMDNILLGFDSLEERRARSNYQGETVGRYANRIARGRFSLGGKAYQVTTNEGGVCLHGAGEFSHALWEAEAEGEHCLALRYTSAAGSHGFPGELQVSVRYALEGSGLRISYEAVSDADTIINLTNHAYFNLAGRSSGKQIFEHVLKMDATHYLPLGEGLIPTGELRAVDGTAFDFRQARPIAQEFDHNFCWPGTIEVAEPSTGRRMTVETDQPGVQLYTGQCLREHCTGFCLETQTWPDGPNHPEFPSCVLRTGEWFRSFTTLKFA